MIKKIFRKIKRTLGIKEIYVSETSKVRHLIIPYCTGLGCDIGFGGDKIMKVNCIGIDYLTPYAYTGKDKVDIACDVMNEKIPINDDYFDYIYSSHLIEDFADTTLALKEFIRILKSGGNLILVFPDQPKYENYCLKTGQPLNTHHVHKEMGYNYMINKLSSLNTISFSILFQSNCEIDYNVIMVINIKKNKT